MFQSYFSLTRRELGSYFASLTGYLIISAVLFLVGFVFSDLLFRLNRDSTDVPVTELFYNSWYFWLILLLASPIITMRSFAHEKASGTFETLATTPVPDSHIVLAKFTGALVFHFLIWLPFLGCILIVRHFTNDTTAFGPGLILSTYLGFILIGALYMSIGCLASALTRSQIVAAMTSFVMGMALFILSFRNLFGSPQTEWYSDVLQYISMTEHMQDFVRGTVDSRFVTFYVTTTAFILYLTYKVLESRRWK
jgi:ABC-2 type transport system permease protein